MRVAVTIIYNGLHHLLHRDFAQFMAENFDYWAVVDGLSQNGGSTKWCNKVEGKPHSTDGSVEFMREFAATHPNVMYKVATMPFKSKDHQVNEAVEMIRRKVKHGYLWQVDVDEKWTAEDLDKAERLLADSPMRQASFGFNHYVGQNLVAVGTWGSGYVNRLFMWRGQRFASHEPPRMDTRGRTLKIDEVRFDHYSYAFEQDVLFKDT